MGNDDSLDLIRAIEIGAIERAALQAWPALETRDLAGWHLRYSHGVTRRANSVWPNALMEQEAGPDLSERIRQVEAYYAARRLPARYQICPAALPANLDNALAERGYAAVAPTGVMVAALGEVCARLSSKASGWTVSLDTQVNDTWLDLYRGVEDVPASEVEVRKAIMQGIPHRSAYAITWADGEPVAVGSIVCSARFAGLFNLGTVPAWRRRGAARAIMHSLLVWAGEQGAETCYLQVMARNKPAIALYEGLGFRTLYAYHYREQPAQSHPDRT